MSDASADLFAALTSSERRLLASFDALQADDPVRLALFEEVRRTPRLRAYLRQTQALRRTPEERMTPRDARDAA